MTATRDGSRVDPDTDVTEVLPRLPARRSLLPRGRLRAAMIAVAALVALGLVGGWLVFASPVFGVHTVRVDGLTESQSALAAQVRATAGIADGTPLVRVDSARAVRAVRALPEVADASVSTSFPHTVTITVRPRTPVGYVRVGGRDVLVDRTGYQYDSTGQRPRGLPRLVVPSGTDARTTGGAVATVASSLPATVLSRVVSVQALDPTAITLEMRSGIVVRWGSPAQSALKGTVLPILLRRANVQVDLTDPHRPFTR